MAVSYFAVATYLPKPWPPVNPVHVARTLPWIEVRPSPSSAIREHHKHKNKFSGSKLDLHFIFSPQTAKDHTLHCITTISSPVSVTFAATLCVLYGDCRRFISYLRLSECFPLVACIISLFSHTLVFSHVTSMYLTGSYWLNRYLPLIQFGAPTFVSTWRSVSYVNIETGQFNYGFSWFYSVPP